MAEVKSQMSYQAGEMEKMSFAKKTHEASEPHSHPAVQRILKQTPVIYLLKARTAMQHANMT